MIWSRPLKTLNLITISKSAVLKNYDTYVKNYPNSHIWPVLKSNAYGHGLKEIATILKSRHPDYLIVDSYYEALEIKKYNSTPILLIGSTHPKNFSIIKLKNITLSIQDLYSLKKLAATKRPVTIHLKLNTGMNRQGIDPPQLSKALDILKNNPQIYLEGLFSHLADADNPKDTFTPVQTKLFLKLVDHIKLAGFNPKYIHLAATAGASKVKHPSINAIRLGLGLYGSALTLTSTIVNVHQLKKGDTVSYNRTFTAKKETNIAVLPVGYFEGLDRRLSNTGYIKYKGKFFKIAGLVCMNLSVVNFKNTVPKIYDSIQIISPQKTDKNSLNNIAKLANTIPYDILVHLSPTIRRVII